MASASFVIISQFPRKCSFNFADGSYRPLFYDNGSKTNGGKSMANRQKENTPPTPRKRRLATLIAAAQCGGEKSDTLSWHARRCTAASMAQGLKHYA